MFSCRVNAVAFDVTRLISSNPRFLLRRRPSHNLLRPFQHGLGSCMFFSSLNEAVILSELKRLNDAPRDVTSERLELPTIKDSDALVRIRHSAAHVLAMAVQKLYPSAQVATGPWTETGFYYDFYIPDYQLKEADLKKIKKAMDRIIRENLPIDRQEITFEAAKQVFLLQQEPFKIEILERIPSAPITMYRMGDWADLCAGPHVQSTGALSGTSIELDSVAGVYWRGDESRPMLQRVYGTAWLNEQQMQRHRELQAEAARRDHRGLGRRLDLFSLQEDAGGGLVFWHPRGSRVRKIIEDYWRNKHIEAGYELIYSPHIANFNLWKTSGHAEFYSEDMFNAIEVDSDKYIVKPMNCPFHCLIYKNTPKSYKDFPIRWAELGTVYRYERSGSMHGLMRVRGFTQDDAHVFCLPDQLEDEIIKILVLIEEVLNKFGFSRFEVSLSTRPEHSVGGDALWSAATTALSSALKQKGVQYDIDDGGGAFYGPKIDIKIRDAIGRKWQCSTIQCDFNLPSRFSMEYTSSDGSKKTPVMIHRAIFGSVERFFGILLESTVGDFPLWLAPEQLRIIAVTDNALSFCDEIQELGRKKYGLRVEVDRSGERLSKQIRNAEMSHVPLMAIVGKKELESDEQLISVRSHKGLDLGVMPASFLFSSMRHVMDTSGAESTR